MLATSCPRCGRDTQSRTTRCRECGFVFFEAGERRRPVPPRRFVTAAVAVVVLAAAAALLLARSEPSAAPDPPEPLPRARAEQRLERQVANTGYDENAVVHCGRSIRLSGATRCHVRYSDGDTQLILVGLDKLGRLDVTVPYPAQRRPMY